MRVMRAPSRSPTATSSAVPTTRPQATRRKGAEASGALSVEGSGVVMGEVDEEWTNFVAPAVDVQLTFGAEPVDAFVPMHLQMGRFEFDVEIRVQHQAGAPVNFGWARDAERRRATCD